MKKLRFLAGTLILLLALSLGCGVQSAAPAIEVPAEPALPGIAAEDTPSESGQVIFTRIGVFSGTSGEIVQEDTTHASSAPDQNAVLCTGGEMTLSRVNVKKSGDAKERETAHLTGLNAAVAAAGGKINLIDGIVTSNAIASDALSAIGKLSNIHAINSYIVTAGVQSAGLTVLDGGTAVLDGCSVATDGENAPCAYVSGVFSAKSSKLRALQSNCMVLENGGQATLSNCELIGSLGVCYRGESEENGGSVTLENCLIAAGTGEPLKIESGNLSLTLRKQQLNGVLSVGEGSLALVLTEGSNFTGTVAAGVSQTVSVSLDASSVWQLSDNTSVGALTDADASLSNIHSNGFTLYYNASLEANEWLNGSAFPLAGGGALVPQI